MSAAAAMIESLLSSGLVGLPAGTKATHSARVQSEEAQKSVPGSTCFYCCCRWVGGVVVVVVVVLMLMLKMMMSVITYKEWSIEAISI